MSEERVPESEKWLPITVQDLKVLLGLRDLVRPDQVSLGGNSDIKGDQAIDELLHGDGRQLIIRLDVFTITVLRFPDRLSH